MAEDNDREDALTVKDNVVDLNCITVLDIPPEKILESAKDARLKHVVVIGEYPDGEEYFVSSSSDSALVNWMIDRAKLALLAMPDEEEEYDENDID